MISEESGYETRQQLRGPQRVRCPVCRVTFFTQTVPDFIAKFGSEPQARQLLGNANTVIAGRIKDGLTAEYVMKTFGGTIVHAHVSPQTTRAVIGDDRDLRRSGV